MDFNHSYKTIRNLKNVLKFKNLNINYTDFSVKYTISVKCLIYRYNFHLTFEALLFQTKMTNMSFI